MKKEAITLRESKEGVYRRVWREKWEVTSEVIMLLSQKIKEISLGSIVLGLDSSIMKKKTELKKEQQK